MFDHVLVDEYQDVNRLQVDIVRLLRPSGRGLTVVGDDAQAIYGFRGADGAHLHELHRALPSCTVQRLEQNFRSRQPILDLANLIRPAASALDTLVLRARREGGRRPRLLRCHDAASEARAVVDAILEQHELGRRLSDQAVLVRAAHHSDLIELELTARAVPYRKFGGLRFLESAHVKDFAAALRLLDNTADDIAWFRLLRLHDGIGPARARQLLETLPPRTPAPLPGWAGTVAAAPPACRVALGESLAALERARSLGGAGQRATAVAAMLRPLIARRYTDGAARLSDLDQLTAAAAARPDLARWLAELVLDPPASTSDLAGPPHLDDDYVVVSTVHSAKGLEWPVVHLPHLVDGAFPSDMALRSPRGLEEERRLFYVACTRARDELSLYSPLRMPHHRRATDDRHSYAQRTRWLDDPALALLQVEEQPPARRHLGRLAGTLSGVAGEQARAGLSAALDLSSFFGGEPGPATAPADSSPGPARTAPV
jgi:DNA helicase-2/ATP-dependent DNA helicase PcrA